MHETFKSRKKRKNEIKRFFLDNSKEIHCVKKIWKPKNIMSIIYVTLKIILCMQIKHFLITLQFFNTSKTKRLNEMRKEKNCHN